MAYFECPRCEEEREIEVNIPDEVFGLEDPCEECGYILTEDEHDKAYMDLLADGFGDAIDHAMSLYEV